MIIGKFLLEKAQLGRFCALIGHPVSHSLSPQMHNLGFKHHGLHLEYHKIDVPSSDLRALHDLFHHPNFVGANVTIPHKLTVRDYLDKTEPEAESIGAVNTIFRHDGQIWGTNTDAGGFGDPLRSCSSLLSGKSAVVFGSGGATRAVIHSLKSLGMTRIYLISRSVEAIEMRAEGVFKAPYSESLSLMKRSAVVVNATPLGMFPNVDTSPLDVVSGVIGLPIDVMLEDLAPPGTVFYDLVYNPLETKFLKQAKSAGLETIDGLAMFIGQGNRAFQRWTGKILPVSEVEIELKNALAAR